MSPEILRTETLYQETQKAVDKLNTTIVFKDTIHKLYVIEHFWIGFAVIFCGFEIFLSSTHRDKLGNVYEFLSKESEIIINKINSALNSRTFDSNIGDT